MNPGFLQHSSPGSVARIAAIIEFAEVVDLHRRKGLETGNRLGGRHSIAGNR